MDRAPEMRQCQAHVVLTPRRRRRGRCDRCRRPRDAQSPRTAALPREARRRLRQQAQRRPEAPLRRRRGHGDRAHAGLLRGCPDRPLQRRGECLEGVRAHRGQRGRRRDRQLERLAHGPAGASRGARGEHGRGVAAAARDHREPELRDHPDGRRPQAAARRCAREAHRRVDVPGDASDAKGHAAVQEIARADARRPPRARR